MSLAIASDHAGFLLKQEIIKYFKENGIKFDDYGCYSLERVDYPDYGVKVGELVASGKHKMGIIICGTGVGISMSANKVKGVRAALCTCEYMVEMARRHNNANVLALGGRTTTTDIAIRLIDIFLHTDFDGGRHSKRVDKIHSLTGK